MRKMIARLLALISLTAVLACAGCVEFVGEAPETDRQESQAADLPSGGEGEAQPEAQQSVGSADAAGSHKEYIVVGEYTANGLERGYYEPAYTDSAVSGFRFYDFEKHTVESLPIDRSVFQGNVWSVMTAAVGDCLYFLADGTDDCIVRMDADWTNPVKVSLPANRSFGWGCAVYDGTSLIMITHEPLLADGKTYLSRLNLAGMAFSDIMEMPAGYETSSISGTWSDGIVLSVERHVTDRTIDYSVATYDFGTGNLNKVGVMDGYDVNTNYIACDGENAFYFCADGSDDLYRCLIAENEVSLAAGDMMSGGFTYGAYVGTCIRDGRVQVRMNHQTGVRNFAYDIRTGELKADPLYSPNDWSFKVPILAETASHFFVQVYAFPFETQYAMITKSDYWNGNANYILFSGV